MYCGGPAADSGPAPGIAPSSQAATASAWRRTGFQPGLERGQSAAIQRDLVATFAVRCRVAQFEDDDLGAHDVELVPAGRATRHYLDASPAEPPIRPPPDAGQPEEDRFTTAITDHTVSP